MLILIYFFFKNKENHRIIASYRSPGWKGALKVIWSNHPCNKQGHLQILLPNVKIIASVFLRGESLERSVI